MPLCACGCRRMTVKATSKYVMGHYSRSKEHRKFISRTNSKPLGSKRMNGDYILVKVSMKPPQWRFEHRIVAEKVLRRKLRKEERVHHIDEIKTNNTGRNLKPMSNSKHMSLHHRNKIVTEETRRRQREAHLGTKLSKSHRRNIGKALKGYKHTATMRRRVRIAKLKYWAERRKG